jgi:DNA end-binding protein Ku
MAPRPYWKGYLKLSLVSCAIALYPAASKSDRIAFNWLNRETRNRLRQQMVDAETNEPVEREDRVRGYQISKNEYLPVEEEELEAVEIESSHTIDIEKFVPLNEIDPVFLDNSLYLAPDDKVAEEAFAVIREAMAEEGVAGIGRAVIGRRERLLVLEPRGKGILATVLHYSSEVRDDHAYFDGIRDDKIPEEMLELAKHIIRSKMGHFDITKFEDRYENALVNMIRGKQAGRPVEAAKPQVPGNVINLMEALRGSIAAQKSASQKPASKDEPDSARRETRTAAASRSEPKRTDSRQKTREEKPKKAPSPSRKAAKTR